MVIGEPLPPSAGRNVDSRRAALVDVLFVVAVSAAAFGLELALKDVLPWGDEARGVIAVLAGAGSAIWVTLYRGRTLGDLGFYRPKRFWTLPFWAIGIKAAFVIAQGAAASVLGQLYDLPQPDMSRYDFIRGNPLGAIGMALALPIVAAVPEEIVYRGFLIDRFARLIGGGRLGIALAALLQALVFGSIHFQWGVGGVIFASVMGAVWGFAYLLCGRNLWIVILAHSTAHIALVAQIYSS